MNNIYEFFMKSVQLWPSEIAVVFERKKQTYEDLACTVNHISAVLYMNNVRRGDVVGVILRRSPNLLATMFAISKIGAAYIPIEPDTPKYRAKNMLQESHVTVIVTDLNAVHLEYNEYQLINLNELPLIHKVSLYEFKDLDYSKDLAYIIYTSGSTGKPKGVKIRQEGIVNLIQNGTDVIGITPGRVIASLSNISFDMSVPETILALCKGLTVILANEKEQKNPALIKKLILQYRVDTLMMAPTRLQLLISYNKDLSFMRNISTLLLGAEKIPEKLFEIVKSNCKEARIFNLYGPTEVTAFVTYSDITNKSLIDIGKPVANMDVFIMDENLEVVGPGEKGEICVSGIGVSSGYVNILEITGDKFIQHNRFKGGALYRTGDYGRALQNGCIEYLGRMDNQVKYKGHRIELEEIEFIVLKFPHIVQAVTDIVTDIYRGELLYLYYTASKIMDESELKNYLRVELPEYMIPLVYQKLDFLPTNQNGKIDRRQLKQ